MLRDDGLLPQPFATLPVLGSAESGLLGIALHPGFESEPWVYVYFSSAETGTNTIARIPAEGNRGGAPEVIFEGLPTASYHDGGDLAFGPDGNLFVSVGEGHDDALAQDPGSPGGKILRIAPDGSIPAGNPFGPESPVWSMGHRNSFGLCFDPFTGNLWETENGPDRDDEVNLIRPGGNYGWPDVSGPGGPEEYEDPAIHFPEVIVPTGCAIYTERWLGSRSQGALFFGDFSGTLHRAELAPHGAVVERHAPYLTGLPGITDVAMGPDGRLYLATEDRILRLPEELIEPSPKPRPSTGPTDAGPEPSPSAIPSPSPNNTWMAWVLAGAILVTGAWLLRNRPPR